MLHKNIIKLAALLWCVLTVASCTNEDFDKGNNSPDVPEGLPVTLKLNVGTPEVPVVETKSLDNGATFGAINDLAVLVYDEKGAKPSLRFMMWKRESNICKQYDFRCQDRQAQDLCVGKCRF